MDTIYSNFTFFPLLSMPPAIIQVLRNLIAHRISASHGLLHSTNPEG
jgi:hypothetical protein